MHLPIKKRRLSVRENPEDANTGGSGSSIAPTATNFNGASLSPAPIGNYYEVFLSFRGQDTRKGFTDHLYNGLINVGIRVFKDEKELRQGEKIRPDLLVAIKNSKILIPVLSVNYGTSSWCLDELVQIVECQNNDKGHIVLPIFYKVQPAHVRHQTGSFGMAFHEREKRLCERGINPTILEKWKQALVEVSSLKGWDAEGPEGELVKLVVREVLSELKKKFELDIPENLVGIDSHVEKIMEFVDNSSRATLFVGIHGMGGIGKTTLAKTIYNKLSIKFEYRSFIADIRESWKRLGVHYLQNQLIYDILKQENQVRNKDEGIKILASLLKGKKVLVLLDDVDNDDHLKALAGNKSWFSSGSRIIITTRNESILDKVRVNYTFEHEEMDEDKSLILFSRHAFRTDSPPSEFEDLTHEVVSTTGGLPLSLEVLGSFLCGKEPKVWKGTINKLRKVPHEKVQDTLRISYEALTYEQKQIFLDIACFFIGTDKRIAFYMWDACDFFPEEGIEVLRFLSLIKFGKNHELRMHDQLRDLGREIVREENKKESQYRSRLWDSKEVLKVLKEDEGTKKIEAIHLSKDSSKGFGKIADQGGDILTGKQFKKLRNLRFLGASGAQFSGDFKNSIKKLKWLQWQNCPSTFEANNFHIKELLVLDMSKSKISDKWQGWSSTMARKLKYLDLTDCRSLEKTIFLSTFENLEVLILRYCERIEQIDSSIRNMKSLVRLDLTGCERLKGLPAEVGKLEALEQLLLRSCRNISVLPDSIEDLQNLEILDICATGIEELPNSIGALQNLEILDVSCIGIKELPNCIGRLGKLRELDASFCIKLGEEMPESLCNLSSLQCLNLDYCLKLQSMSALPSNLTYLRITCQSRRLPSLSNLMHLKELRLSDCEFLEGIWEHPSTLLENSPNTPFQLEILDIYRCRLMETVHVAQFNHLRTLSAKYCDNILEIRGLDKLQYLENLQITYCASIEMLDLPKSECLKILSAHNCKNLVEIQGLDRLEFLKELHIFSCTSIERLNLPKSKVLKILDPTYCENLVEIQGLDRLESLEEIDICECTSIVRLDLPKSHSLKIFHAKNCENLVEIHGLDRLKFLEELSIYKCAIERLDLPKSESLKIFNAKHCEKLVEIQGLNRLESLEEIDISRCTSIARLYLPKYEGLKIFNAKHCENLVEIQDLNRLEFLEEIDISGCTSIQRLELPKSKGLRKLFAGSCKNLFEIQGLDTLLFLKVLDMSGCTSFGRLPELCCFDTLHKLAINCCDNLHDIKSLERFPSCTILWIEDCKSSAKFPNLSNFRNLGTLFLSNCNELREIPGLEQSTSLGLIAISGCSSIEILPDLSSCTNLVSLVAQNCEKLTELRGLEKLENLLELDISGCKSLKTIPVLTRTRIYQNYEMGRLDTYDARRELIYSRYDKYIK